MLIKKKTNLTNLLRSTKTVRINIKQILRNSRKTIVLNTLKQIDSVKDLLQSLMTLNIQAFILSSVYLIDTLF